MKISNSYAELGELFYQQVKPAPVDRPELFLWNEPLAEDLLLNQSPALDEASRASLFSGNELLPGSKPIAMAYAGHQFGHFVPQLGDGRAHLLGEFTDSNGVKRDVQLKGSGQTAFSRNGDGRCALGPAIREFVMSEAMHALKIPTTRCLAVTTTGEEVYREALPWADRIYLTIIEAETEGDRFFPGFRISDFDVTTDPRDGYTFYTLDRKDRRL